MTPGFRTLSILTLSCTLCIVNVFAQSGIVKNFNVPVVQWSQGSIMLRDGTELTGHVSYNNVMNLVHFSDSSDTEAFIPANIVGFEFFDEANKRQRVFYSLGYKHPDEGMIKWYIFEVLMEFEDFALLSRYGGLEYKDRRDFGSYRETMNVGLTATVYTQKETLYFLNSKGDILPYLEITRESVDDMFFSRNVASGRILDPESIMKLAGGHYEKLKVFASANKLDFGRKRDVIRIMAHLKELKTSR